MRKLGLLGSSAICSATFIGLSIALAAPAYAQDTDEVTQADDPDTLGQNEVELESGREAQQGEEILVTGSRIRRPNLDSAVPITSVGVQELTSTGNPVLGDELNELPALRSTFSQSNSTRFIGTAGLNLLDLRGLGTARTLVLVNGRRHVTSTPGSFSVDVNTIPTDLLERVDVVTGGNSAIYGSDAVAGVVNFVLKRNFDGVRLRGQAGVSDEGDRPSYFVSLTAGKNFADDRGNVAINLEYAKAKALYYTDRDEQYGAYSGRNQFNAVENTIGEPSTGNGIPDTAFLRGVRNANISEGSTLITVNEAGSVVPGAFCPVAVAPTNPNFAEIERLRALNCTGASFGGTQYGDLYLFDQTGTLVANPCITDLRRFGSSNCVGGLGSTLLLTGQLQPGYDRKMANLLASFEISPAFQPFIEAKYVRVDAVQEGQPTFGAWFMSINNPFLNAQSRATLQQILPAGSTSFAIQRFNIDFGGRGEDHRREVYRIVGGVQGDFNDDWRYEVALNYGRFESYYETEGNIHNARFANARNAVLNANGQIVCAINNDASTANDDPACVPVNLFGFGSPSQAALDYFRVTSSREQKAQQYNATAFISGDLSQLFELPGGPVGFAVGAEYRRETAYSAFDPLTQSGATFLNAIATFDPPALEVKEAFGEIRVPLVRDVPFFHELTVEAAGRFSNYNVSDTGTVFAYNVSGIWAPIRDIRFRAGYARSVRAPTLSDLFTANSQTFANALADPCSAQNINNNPNRAANCAAAGIPVGFVNIPTSGVPGFNRGNPVLNEERGKSLTVGFVAQPRFLPGFSLSVDYYDITLDDAIFTLAGQTIINQCYDNPGGINNPFCAVVFRQPNGRFQGQPDLQGNPTSGPAFFAQPFNFAKLETAGVDLDAAYRRDLGGVDLNLRALVSWVRKRNFFTDINNPNFADRAKSELGDPAWAGRFDIGLDFGNWDLGYNVRWIGKQTIGTYETQNSFQGRPPQNPDAFPQVWTPNVFYHNARLAFDVNDKFQFYGGVDNLFDRHPPFSFDATGAGTAVYENVGRFFYFGAEVNF